MVKAEQREFPDGMSVIQDNTDITVALPWNGHYGMFTIHIPNATQLRACGDFSTLNLVLSEDENDQDEPSLDAIKEIKNMQERMMKITLVKPSFDEVFEYLNTTELVSRMKDTMKHIKEQLKLVEDVDEMHAYETELEGYELFLGFLFPDDFTDALVSTVLQRDTTDISKVTEDMLLEAALLAERGHDNPADHMDGMFTELQRQDINKYGWIILAKHREREKIEKDVSKKWVRGRSRKRR